MTWTYSGDPSASPKDEMRFVLGDTIQMAIFPIDSLGVQVMGLVSDEEINYALTKYAPNYSVTQGGAPFFTAAKVLCDSIVAKFTPYVNESTGDESVEVNNRIDQYRKLSQEMEAKIAYNGLTLYAGGTNRTENQTLDNNCDLIKPVFKIGQDDNPYAVENPEYMRDPWWPNR